MLAINRMTLAFAVAALGFACGDDGDDDGDRNIDAGPQLDGQVPSNDGGGGRGIDAAALACTSYTLPTANTCGGSHCQESQAQLTAGRTSSSPCQKEAEVAQFCQLSSVKKVTDCVVPAALQGLTGAALETSVSTCATAALPDYTATCLNCFVKSAVCAAARENCFEICGSNPNTTKCDQCRIDKGCIDNFYTCAGFDNPLP